MTVTMLLTGVDDANADAGVVGEVHQYGAALEYWEVVEVGIDDGWNSAIRRDLQEIRLVLCASGEINRHHFVRNTRVLKQQRDLPSVWCGRVEEPDGFAEAPERGTHACERVPPRPQRAAL